MDEFWPGFRKIFYATAKETRLAALERQLERVKRRLIWLRGRSNRYAWLRLGIFVVGVVATIAAFGTAGWPLGLAVIVVGFVVFNVVAYFHRQIDNSIARHEIWLEIKTAHIARIKLDWERIPVGLSPSQLAQVPGARATEIENDLDLTGPRSVHHLLNTATSADGSQRLRRWLVNTQPDAPHILARQQLVQELAPLSIFRDKLTLYTKLASRHSKEQWEGQRLLNWLQKQKAVPMSPATLIILAVLSACNITFFILSRLGLLPNLWLFSFLLYAVVYTARAGQNATALDEVYTLQDGLAKLRAVLEYLEKFRYGKHLRLKKLCQPFLNPTQRPSVRLRELNRIVVAVSLQRNFILWFVINLIVPWSFYFAYRLSQYKAKMTGLLPVWLDRVFELEALNSLATFSYLNPEYTFPKIISDTPPQAEIFKVKQVGHPLIASDQKVCNDFAMQGLGEIVIITGSNMAGKSSFLRTLGVNLCLAYAGGPVNAQKFQTQLFRLFTCIRISDSVTDGFSYFYAEVRRLRELLDEFNQPDAKLPLFFLIDEIFKGTNNRERLIGSRAYLEALVGHSSVGLVSTHDLELVTLADNNPDVKNYHFKEDVADGRMVFSYRLLDGPSESTNALKIMQQEGLPVEIY